MSVADQASEMGLLTNPVLFLVTADCFRRARFRRWARLFSWAVVLVTATDLYLLWRWPHLVDVVATTAGSVHWSAVGFALMYFGSALLEVFDSFRGWVTAFVLAFHPVWLSILTVAGVNLIRAAESRETL